VYPHSFEVSPDGRWLVVANTGGASVSVVDAQQHAVVATLPVGAGPSHVVFDEAGECAYVACSGANTVAVVAPACQEIVATILAGPAGSVPGNDDL
jgi:YVTN family beta-propeller protein